MFFAQNGPNGGPLARYPLIPVKNNYASEAFPQAFQLKTKLNIPTSKISSEKNNEQLG